MFVKYPVQCNMSPLGGVHRLTPCSPAGVTWFVATEDEPSDDRKENRPEKWAGPRQQEGEGPGRGRGSVWFEAYCRSQPWREPLRERQVQGDGAGRDQAVRSDPRPDQEPLAKTTSSRLVPLSLQVGVLTHWGV